MSENMFGVSRTKPTRKVAEQIDQIAKKHGAYLVEASIPGTGYQRWFCSPNHGEPFNREVALAVHADLRAAGIYGADNTLTAQCRAKAVRS